MIIQKDLLPFINIPFIAPTEVPTIIAVGVAKPVIQMKVSSEKIYINIIEIYNI